MTARRSLVAALAALGLSAGSDAFAFGATAPARAPAATAQTAEGAELPAEDAAQTSTEQGQTPIDQSFGVGSYARWVRETRRQAWRDTKWDLQLRSYYLTRDRFDGSQSEAWAMGGSVAAKTGYFRERFAFGATAYTSQPVYAPDGRDGTQLLKPGQEGYAVLGELYGEFLITDEARLSIGRRGIDTPFINRNDGRMTPNTFESVTLLGAHAGADGAEWRWGGGYFDGIKERNSEDFISMSEDAGAPAGVHRGVFAVGGNYSKGNFSFGAIGYHSDDIINILYAETRYAIPFPDGMKLQFALQYAGQASTGDDLLTGASFDADQWGAKLELGDERWLLTTAYTRAGGEADMRGPWSGYPGYTSVQLEDFNRRGEDAWLVRAGYTFASAPGLSVYGLYVDGSDPGSATQYAKSEYDLNVQWAPPEGALKGLVARLRYARVSHDDPGGTASDDLRLMVYYDPPGF